jgi:hypothetical protein
VEKRSRRWRREGRIAGAGERLVSIDDMPIKDVAAIGRFQTLVDLCNRFTLFVLAFVGLVSAACIAGLPSTTCYALADAYTIALENIGHMIVFAILLYYSVWALDYAGLAGIILVGAVAEGYSPAEAKSCPALQPCAEQQALPPWAPHGPESDSSNSARPYTTSTVMATGSTGSAAAFGGSGGFFIGEEGISVIKGSFGPTGPTGPSGGLATGAPSGYVPTGPAGP